MKLWISILLILTGFSTFSQFPTPKSGPEYETDKKEFFNGFLGENDLAIYTADYLYISRKKQELNIRKFHKEDLQLVESVNIYHEQIENYYNDPLEIYFLNNQLFLISRLEGERERTELLTLEVFDQDMQSVSMTVIDTLDPENELSVEVASDNSGIIVAHYNKFSQLTEQLIYLTSIDQKGEIAWKEELKSPMALQNLKIDQICFDRNSPIYILCNNVNDFAEKENNQQRLINNKYSLWSYDKRSHFLKEFDIRMKNKWINGVKMKLDQKRNLILSGFYNETRNFAIRGVFSLTINNRLKVLGSTLVDFDKDIIAKFVEDKDLEKVRELDDFEVRDLAIMDNGSFFLLGENYYRFIERNYDPRTNLTTTTTHYNYNAIVVSYFDSTGHHQWTEAITKYQNSTNDNGRYSSYCVMNNGKSVYLIFNDAERNNIKDREGQFNYSVMFNYRKFQISCVKLNKDGVQERGGLVEANNSFILRAKESTQIQNNMMYLLGETGKHSRIFAIDFKD